MAETEGATGPSLLPSTWSGVDASGWQKRGRWAAPQHYMCSYMAMFPPELPHYFIERFTKPGDRVLDPFSGRGTTAVEAAAQGRHGIGNDLNPLAVALTRGKLSNPNLGEVMARLDELERGYDPSSWTTKGQPDRILMLYHENTMRQLVYLKATLDWSTPGVDAFIVAVLMGAMHGGSKGFLSLPMPNTFSMGWGYIERKVREEPEKFACPDRDAFAVLGGRVKRQLSKGCLVGTGETIYGDVRDIAQKVEHDSIHLLFTSPPYLKVIKYGLYNWIRLWFLTETGGHEEVDEVLDDTHAIGAYMQFMTETMEACLPTLDRSRGLSCWAIGDVKGVNLAQEVWRLVARHIKVPLEDGTELRYRLLAIVEDEIPPEEKVTKLWKTTKYVVRRTDDAGETVEEFMRTSKEPEAKAFLAGLTTDMSDEEASAYEVMTVRRDLSGKATPVDRILMMCPHVAKPESYVEHDDVRWDAFHAPRSVQTKLNI